VLTDKGIEDITKTGVITSEMDKVKITIEVLYSRINVLCNKINLISRGSLTQEERLKELGDLPITEKSGDSPLYNYLYEIKDTLNFLGTMVFKATNNLES